MYILVHMFIMIVNNIYLLVIDHCAAKFNCTVPGTLHKHSTDCPAPQTTTTTIDSDNEADGTAGQGAVKRSGKTQKGSFHETQ